MYFHNFCCCSRCWVLNLYCVGRDELIKTGAQLVLRRKQLLAELMLIYPVIQVTVVTYIEADMFFYIKLQELPLSRQYLSNVNCLEVKRELLFAVLCTTVVHTCIHTRAHTHAHTHVHMHTHTHAHMWAVFKFVCWFKFRFLLCRFCLGVAFLVFLGLALVIISAKWTKWTAEISCDAFFRPSVRTQYLDANISKMVWVRDLVPINH